MHIEKSCPPGLKLVRENIFGFHHTRARISMFDPDLEHIHHLMELHGIGWSDLDLRQCRSILACHFALHHRQSGVASGKLTLQRLYRGK